MGESSSGRTSVLSVMEVGSGGGGLDLLETGHSPTESVRQDEKFNGGKCGRHFGGKTICKFGGSFEILAGNGWGKADVLRVSGNVVIVFANK